MKWIKLRKGRCRICKRFRQDVDSVDRCWHCWMRQKKARENAGKASAVLLVLSLAAPLHAGDIAERLSVPGLDTSFSVEAECRCDRRGEVSREQRWTGIALVAIGAAAVAYGALMPGVQPAADVNRPGFVYGGAAVAVGGIAIAKGWGN